MKSSQNELRSCVSNIKIYGNLSDRCNPSQLNSTANYLPNSHLSLSSENSRFMSNSHLSYQNVSTYSVNVGGSGNCRQSLSGSETDISTSTENLTHEEKYVLRNSTRQEPQGEETLEAEETSVGGGGGSGSMVFQGGPTNRNSSYASMDQSSCGTLIIHKDIDDDDDDDDEDVQLRGSTSTANLSSRYDSPSQARLHHSLGNYYNGGAARQHSYESELKAIVLPKEIKGIPKHYLDQSQVLKHLALEVQKSNTGNMGMEPPLISNSSQYQQTTFFGADFDVAKLPPPPEYPGKLKSHLNNDNSSSTTPTTDSSPATTPAEVKAQLGDLTSKTSPTGTIGVHSRSQPDLSQVGRWDEGGVKKSAYMSQRPKTKGKASPEIPAQVLHQRVQSAKYGFSSSDILSMDKFSESLIVENRSLKSELELYKNKVSRLQKCEMDIQQIHQAYEELVKSSQKRERLDQAVRSKLEIELRRQQEINKDIKVQFEALNSHMYRKKPAVDFPNINEKVRHDLQCRDQLITQLIQQNKELTASKERHEIELAAQRATLQEQRNHIDILDKALNNAQSNVLKLEEECRKKQTYIDQLQKALKHAQMVSERREQNEKKLRNRLLKDVEELRQRIPKYADGKSGDHVEGQGTDIESRSSCGNLANGSGIESDEHKCDEEGGIDTLKRAIREKDNRIMALESEVSKWEQHYLEENAMRQIAIDAASMPKDAKIAALERTSQESEKLIAQARSEKLKQMDELHASNKRCADFEARLKQLESQLAERDAMIKVLQKQSCDKDLAIQSAMMRLPRNPSYHVATSSKPSSSSGRSNSLSAVTSSSSMTPSSSSTTSSNSSVQESLDDQLKKLDSELLSKNSIIQALRSEKAKYPNHYWMV
ncbi:hypothetical protein CHUAL_003457 [Chamberlinius hualienensis]